MSFCKEFETIEEASEKYPSKGCKECEQNQFDPDEGLQTCIQVMQDITEMA